MRNKSSKTKGYNTQHAKKSVEISNAINSNAEHEYTPHRISTLNKTTRNKFNKGKTVR